MESSVYWKALQTAMLQIRDCEREPINRGAEICARTIERDGIIHTFGTGHSALSAGDTFFRAGGLACVNAILEPSLSIQAGGPLGCWVERQSGIASLILDRYDLRAEEPLIIFSNSGVNTVPIEIAIEGRKRGLMIIAIVSRTYCEAAAWERHLKTTLISESEIVIDNHGPVGDSVVPIPGVEQRLASLSLITASLIYNLMMEQSAALLTQRGVEIPVFMSVNLAGSGEHNARLLDRYRSRIRHL